MPAGDGFAWVCEHLIPVITSQTLSSISHMAHTNNLIVTYAVNDKSISMLKMWQLNHDTPKNKVFYQL